MRACLWEQAYPPAQHKTAGDAEAGLLHPEGISLPGGDVEHEQIGGTGDAGDLHTGYTSATRAGVALQPRGPAADKR